MENLKIIYMRENLLQSVLADIFTFGFLAGTSYINYRFMNNNTALSIILLIMFCFFVTTKSSAKKHTFKSFNELEEFINKQKAAGYSDHVASWYNSKMECPNYDHTE